MHYISLFGTSRFFPEHGRRLVPRRRMIPAIAADHAIGFREGMHTADVADKGEVLVKGQLRQLPARELTLLCLAGELWVTRDGDAEDYILGPGQHLALGRDDQAVVQALQASRMCLAAP